MADPLIANNGTNWTSTPSPVDPDEARTADAELDTAAASGQGPGATNEVKHGWNVKQA